MPVQPAIAGGRTFHGPSAAGGALDGATMTSGSLDGSGFITDAGAIEDSGAYIQTYGDRAVFQVPRDGKYLVTAEWRVDNTLGSLEPRSNIARWDSGGSGMDNRHCQALTGSGGDTGGWGFVHTIQIACLAMDYIVFQLAGGVTPMGSVFSITYLYAPILAPS